MKNKKNDNYQINNFGFFYSYVKIMQKSHLTNFAKWLRRRCIISTKNQKLKKF